MKALKVLLAVACSSSGWLHAAWGGEAGILATQAPAFDGASDRHTLVVPVMGIRFNRGYYLGPSRLGSTGALGYSTNPSRDWTFIGEFGITAARLERRAHHYLGLGDRLENYGLGLGVQRNFGPTYLRFGAHAGVRNGSGVNGRLSLGHRVQGHAWMMEFQGSATLSDTRNMNYDFGVSQEAADRRSRLWAAGDPRLDPRDMGAYAPRGGLRDASASVAFIYPAGPKLSWLLIGSGKYLFRQAGQSPLVRERMSGTLACGMIYRF